MKLYYNTVSKDLSDYLKVLMNADAFNSFRLVGGTALSLQLGHRLSIDIDLFTDAEYGTVDFNLIEQFLSDTFEVSFSSNSSPALGKAYFLRMKNRGTIKLDVFYSDNFMSPAIEIDNFRIATISDIAAMKIDVIQRGGRKKDFWDIHELMNHFSIKDMIDLHKNRYPYSHNKNSILDKLTDFKIAGDDFEPNCLKGKYWEFIKEDIEDALEML